MNMPDQENDPVMFGTYTVSAPETRALFLGSHLCFRASRLLKYEISALNESLRKILNVQRVFSTGWGSWRCDFQ